VRFAPVESSDFAFDVCGDVLSIAHRRDVDYVTCVAEQAIVLIVRL
jgi:hypothetical protein